MEKTQVRLTPEETARQRAFMDKVRAMGGTRYCKVITYGCQQNENDSERLLGMLEAMGYTPTEDNEKANVILFNTCAVREGAELKVYGNIGALKHLCARRQDLLVGVCGCMMQQEAVAERIRRQYRHVGLVFGTHSLYKFPELLYECLTEHTRRVDVTPSDGRIIEDMPVHRSGAPCAWVSVMYGCNNFCTYCIVPYVRGRERSRRPEDILAEVREVVARGAREVTLLGQNVNSYGKDLDCGVDFAALLRMVNDVPGLLRIRFMTSHPKDMSERLLVAMAECDKVCPQLHLPFQAGNDRVLAAMNRRYDKAGYLALVEAARAHIPGLSLTSDVIVGFPGETEAEFLDTLDVLARVRFDSVFSFIYSKRSGTPAAEMPDPFTHADKQARFERLLEVQNRISHEINQGYAGKVCPVLVEGPSKTDPTALTGRTDTGKVVNFPAGAARPGDLVRVRITQCQTWSLWGELES